MEDVRKICKSIWEKNFTTQMCKVLEKIQHKSFYQHSIMKAPVERFNRILKNGMWKQFMHNWNYKWIDLLPRLVSKYNAWKHQTIGMRPIDVTPMIADKLLNTVYSSVKAIALPRFKVGNSVRVSKFKTIFEKGYTPNWTTEMLESSKYRKLFLWRIYCKIIAVEKETGRRRILWIWVASRH